MARGDSSRLEKSFGSLLRRKREAKELSQEELADRSGLHRTYISQIERGLKSPSLNTLQALAHALDMDIIELLRDLPRSR